VPVFTAVDLQTTRRLTNKGGRVRVMRLRKIGSIETRWTTRREGHMRRIVIVGGGYAGFYTAPPVASPSVGELVRTSKATKV
jgi:hypothetical protein